MPLTNFTKGVRGAAPVSVTGSTQTVNANDHAFRPVVLNRAAGIAVTLPAATGSGDTYSFYVGTAVTSNTTTIKVANASDTMTGAALLFQDAAETTVGFATAATDDTVTMDGSTRGGLKGAKIMLIDIAANLWSVDLVGDASGTEATPFSATV